MKIFYDRNANNRNSGSNPTTLKNYLHPTGEEREGKISGSPACVCAAGPGCSSHRSSGGQQGKIDELFYLA